MGKSKINMVVDDDYLQRIDAFAKSKYMTRTGLIIASLDNYMRQDDITTNLKKLNDILLKLSVDKEISEEDKNLLNLLSSVSS